MKKRKLQRSFALALVGTVAIAACGSSSKTTATTVKAAEATTTAAPKAAEKVNLKLLVDDGTDTGKLAAAVTKAFTDKNPNITFSIETRPGGADGDNLVKTKLATGDMGDVFWYNSGALLAALKPADSIVDLTGDKALANVDPSYTPVVSQAGKVYGVPVGTGMGGGILYNKKVFADNGLKVPTTWAEFEANNDKLKAAKITAVGASYGDTWTSQLFVLADYNNVSQAVPNFAADYTGNKVKYASTPAALAGFEHLAEAKAKGWYNDDFGTLKFEQTLPLLASGKIAQYPMLTFALSGLVKADPGAAQNIGFFAQPGTDAAKNGVTLWMPSGAYIAKTSKHVAEAKSFLAFLASVEGTDVMTATIPPGGPYLVKGAKLPADAMAAVKDMQTYIGAGKVTPALEFLSPIKGPALEQITVAVGSGINTPAEGAKLYDQDVEKQGKQLGLPGW